MLIFQGESIKEVNTHSGGMSGDLIFTLHDRETAAAEKALTRSLALPAF